MGRWLQAHRGWAITVVAVAITGVGSWWAVDRSRAPGPVAISDPASAVQPDSDPATSTYEPTAPPESAPDDLAPHVQQRPVADDVETVEPSPTATAAQPSPPAPSPPTATATASTPPPSPSPSPSAVPAVPLTVTASVDRAHYYARELVTVSGTACNDSAHEQTYESFAPDPWLLAVQDRTTNFIATDDREDAPGREGPYQFTFAPGECRSASWVWDRVIDTGPYPGPAPADTYRGYVQYAVRVPGPENRSGGGQATSAWFALHDGERPENEPPPPGEPEPWVVVRVDTDQDVYVAGETVAITIEVCNTTDETQHHRSSRADPVVWWTDYVEGGNPGSNGASDGATTTIEAHQCLSFDFEWDQIVDHASSDDARGAQPGERAPVGEYRLSANWDIFEWESESYRKGDQGLLTSTTFELR